MTARRQRGGSFIVPSTYPCNRSRTTSVRVRPAHAGAAARAARACVEGERLLVTIGPGLVLAVDTELLAEEVPTT